MASRKKMFAVLACILVAITVLGCSKNDEFKGDYKLIHIEASDESGRDEEFFIVNSFDFTSAAFLQGHERTNPNNVSYQESLSCTAIKFQRELVVHI